MRVRPHVNPFRVEYLDRGVQPVALPAGDELEVELGCAEAQFLFERAARCSQGVSYVGLEIRRELVDAVNRRAESIGAPVRAVFCHANHDLGALFATGSVTRLYVNFPDPWFKKRHHKRRVMDAALAAEVARVLRPGGELLFQSDVFDLALDALGVLEETPGLRNRAGGWSFWRGGNPYGVRSRREEGCLAEGAPIWRMLYDRA